ASRRRALLPSSVATEVSEDRISATPANVTSSIPISRHSSDRARRGHLSNSLVTGVRDEEISGAVDCHISWARVTKLSGSRGSAFPAKTNRSNSISRHSGDRARRGHLANSTVTGVRDEKISGAVDRHTSWGIQPSGNSQSAVAAGTGLSRTSL